jgi:hypothetical protein
MAYVPEAMRQFYDDTRAATTRDRIARGGMPRQLGGVQPDAYLRQPWNDFWNDPERDYRMAATGGAGPKGGAAMSTRDRMETVDAARNVRRGYDAYQSQEYMAQRQRQAANQERNREIAMMQGGGGPPSSAAGSGDSGLTMGADGVLSGGGGPVSRRPAEGPVSGAAPTGGIANATGVVAGSPMQTAAYQAGLAQGPPNKTANSGKRMFAEKAAANPTLQSKATAHAMAPPPSPNPPVQSEASKRMGGFASDRMMQPPTGNAYDDAARARGYDPENDLDAAMLSGMSRQMGDVQGGITLNDVDLQEMLAMERPRRERPPMLDPRDWAGPEPMNDPRAEAESLAKLFGGADPYDATGSRAEARRTTPGAMDRQLAELMRAEQSGNPYLEAAARENIEPVRRESEAAQAVQAAILREQTGAPSPYEEEQARIRNEQFATEQGGLNRRAAMNAASDIYSRAASLRADGFDREADALEMKADAILASDRPAAGDSAGAAPGVDQGGVGSPEEWDAEVEAAGGDQFAIEATTRLLGPRPGGSAATNAPVTPERAASSAAPSAASPPATSQPMPMSAIDEYMDYVVPGTPEPPPPAPTPRKRSADRSLSKAERQAALRAEAQMRSDEEEEATRGPERAAMAKRIREQRAANLPYDPASTIPWYDRLDEARWREAR